MSAEHSQQLEQALRQPLEIVHDRFQREIVETLNICPFARRARELGQVHRSFYKVTEDGPTPDQLAREILRIESGDPKLEILLLVLPPPKNHSWRTDDRFDSYCRSASKSLESIRRTLGSTTPPWYMVSFHPLSRDRARRATADSFVAELRRSPDPLIQCVRADILDGIRARACEGHRLRVRAELERSDPRLAELFDQSIVTDGELSSDIAEQNFTNHGHGDGRRQLQTVLDSIHRARAELQPPAIVEMA